MGVLSGLEPESVFYYFEEITKIPHGSGNVERISDYLADFAKQRGLFCIQDAWKNIIIVKHATPGYEKEPPLILQGHMDMVAVCEPGCTMDMKKEGLKVAVAGDNIYAEQTSLGGDDGIAVAYALAILDSQTLKHPRLEVVITVDEEVGMDGAREIDLSMLRANRMINLDSEEEGIFLTSCAGGARVSCIFDVEQEERRGILCGINVGGLQGGHSGTEIHRERANSNCLFARVLKRLTDELPIQLVEIKGGHADNAISRETKAIVLLPGESGEPDNMQSMTEQANRLDAIMTVLQKDIAAELAVRDPGFTLNWNINWKINVQKMPALQVLTEDSTRKIAVALNALPNGVQAMSQELRGMVETSLNFGMLRLKNNKIVAEFAVRSSVESAKKALIDRMASVVELADGTYIVSGDYPGWQFRTNSPLRDKMVAVYQQMYGVKPKVEAVHAGLECGLLGSKIQDLDCVSIGPDMKDIHTTEETLSISSTARVWNYLVKLLETKDNFA
ncbi:MAG: aminoacyl-histidine dipeptidase [Lachnospiraceae bacterium]|nr:aminoacyl-histidine dipeptidase [Lachnospiraceae bacterium]